MNFLVFFSFFFYFLFFMNLLSNRRLYGMNRMDDRDCRNDEWWDIWD
jgi:hypothetical protein